MDRGTQWVAGRTLAREQLQGYSAKPDLIATAQTKEANNNQRRSRTPILTEDGPLSFKQDLNLRRSSQVLPGQLPEKEQDLLVDRWQTGRVVRSSRIDLI